MSRSSSFESIERKYTAVAMELAKIVKTLGTTPSPQSIHDLRVRIRRLRSVRSLLPKWVRAETSLYEQSLKAMMKSTSDLRDADILLATLRPFASGLPGDLTKKLGESRARGLQQTVKAAAAFPKGKAPPLLPKGFEAKKLPKRWKSEVRKRESLVRNLLKESLRNEGNKDELHGMRIEVKKLRYLLEVSPSRARLRRALTEWQDLLGTIHDYDVAEAYLSQNCHSCAGTIEQIREKRHEAFVKFVQLCDDPKSASEYRKVLASA